MRRHWMGSGYELARAIELLIKNGHNQDRVWRYTPREIFGWIQLIQRRELGETKKAAETINLGNAMGQADKSGQAALKKLFRKMEDEAQ